MPTEQYLSGPIATPAADWEAAGLEPAQLGGFYRDEEERNLWHSWRLTLGHSTEGNDHETCNNRIGYGFCAFEHIRTCTSWRRIGIGRGRNFRRLRRHRQRNWLDVERQHDRNGGRVGNFSEQHPESVREYPRTQSFAERVNIDPHRSRFGSQQVKEKAPRLRGAFFTTLGTRCTDPMSLRKMAC